MIVTMEVTIAIATLLALPIHTSIDDAGLSVGHFGTLHSTRYRYSDVTKITVTEGLRLRDGSLQKRPAITLDFGNVREVLSGQPGSREIHRRVVVELPGRKDPPVRRSP